MLALEALGIPAAQCLDREVPVQCGLMPILIIPNRESSRSIFSCILGMSFYPG